MNRSVCIFITLTMFVFAHTPVMFAGGTDERDTAAQKIHELPLSKGLRRLLSAEMNGIQSSMTNLTTVIPAGQWDSIAETAGKMREGYIMSKKLSAAEMAAFLRSLPSGYREIDNEFQEAISRLIKAAGTRDSGLVNLYFSKLNESCVTCHSRYATKRFPGFK